jgi:hypothetical protein
MAEYRTKQPGDVLLLREDLDGASAGFYVWVNPYADGVTLCLLGEDPESGDLVTTAGAVTITLADLSCFFPTGLTVEFVTDTSVPSDLAPGDILEALRGASVPIGLYQVTRIEDDDVLLSRLHSNEDDKLATTGRVSWISCAELGAFRKLQITEDLLP